MIGETMLEEKIETTAVFLKEKGIVSPEFGLILGSGLGAVHSQHRFS